jgi:hypothetical protein
MKKLPVSTLFIAIYLFTSSLYATEFPSTLSPCISQNDSRSDKIGTPPVFCIIPKSATSQQNCPNGYKVIAQSVDSATVSDQIKGQIYYPKNLEEFYQYQALGYQPYVFGNNSWADKCGEKQKFIKDNYYDSVPNATSNVVYINQITQTCFVPYNGCMENMKMACSAAEVESIYNYFFQYIAMIQPTSQTISHSDPISYQLCAKN